MASKKPSVEAVFHALADPTRRSMVEKLSQGPLSVSGLATPLDMTLAAVVQHLQLLENAGLVLTEKLGRTRTCQVNPQGIAVVEQWAKDRRSIWEQRLDKLGEIL